MINTWQTADGPGKQPWRVRLPAWGLSLLVHVLVLLLLALAIQRLPGRLVEQPDRPVGLLLAHRTPNQPTEYLDQQEAEAAATAAAPAAGQPLLPEADVEQSLLLPNVSLPERPSGPIAAELGQQLVHAPSMHKIGRRPIIPGEGTDEILAEEAARRRKRSGPTGPSAEVSVFGSGPARGHKFVFVVDRSKSMGSDGLGALGAAADELMRALSQLKPNHQFQVIAYHHKPIYVMNTRKLLPATPENLAAVRQYFATMAAFGATDHEMALLAALRLNPDAVFLLTDGGDPYLNPAQLEYVTSRAGGRTAIHCIQFGAGEPAEGTAFMAELARRNHGSYTYVDLAQRGMRWDRLP